MFHPKHHGLRGTAPGASEVRRPDPNSSFSTIRFVGKILRNTDVFRVSEGKKVLAFSQPRLRREKGLAPLLQFAAKTRRINNSLCLLCFKHIFSFGSVATTSIEG